MSKEDLKDIYKNMVKGGVYGLQGISGFYIKLCILDDKICWQHYGNGKLKSNIKNLEYILSNVFDCDAEYFKNNYELKNFNKNIEKVEN